MALSNLLYSLALVLGAGILTQVPVTSATCAGQVLNLPVHCGRLVSRSNGCFADAHIRRRISPFSRRDGVPRLSLKMREMIDFLDTNLNNFVGRYMFCEQCLTYLNTLDVQDVITVNVDAPAVMNVYSNTMVELSKSYQMLQLIVSQPFRECGLIAVDNRVRHAYNRIRIAWYVISLHRGHVIQDGDCAVELRLTQENPTCDNLRDVLSIVLRSLSGNLRRLLEEVISVEFEGE